MKKLLKFLGTIALLSVLNSAWADDSEGGFKLKSKDFIYESDQKSLITNLAVVIRAGSMNDPKGKEGITRLAHLALIRGTKSKSREDFVNQLETLGAMINVDCSPSRTLVKLQVINENLEPAIKLLADALLNPAFSEDEMKSMLVEELAKVEAERANNRQLLRRTYRQALYQGTSLAFPPEGTPAGIKDLTAQQLRDAFTSTFKRGNILWAASSQVKREELTALIEKNFGAIPEGAAIPRPSLNIAKIEGRQVYVVNRPGASTTEMIIGQHGIVANDPSRIALEAGMFVFGSDFTSRLSKVLRQENGWTYGAYASYQMIDNPRSYGGYFTIYSYPQAQFTEKALPKAVEMFEDYVANGVTAEELEYAKNSQGNSYPFTFATANDRMMGRIYHELDGAPYTPVAEFRRKIGAITSDSIKAAVQKAHNPKNFVMILVGDKKNFENLGGIVTGLKETKWITDPMEYLDKQ